MNTIIAPETVRDIGSGTIAGLCAKVVEFPFDTVKVSVQVPNSPYTGYVDCATRIVKAEGIWGLYRGIGAPMAGGGMENAVCFSFYGFGLRSYRWALGYKEEEKLPMTSTLWAGAVAGVAVSHVLTPVELLKCQMQNQNLLPVEKREFTGVFDCARKTLKADGLGGLFKGHTATLARETPGNAAWFGFYNLAQMAMVAPGQSTDDLPGYKKAFAGGFGGVMYWTTFFPADVVKTRMQIDPTYAKMGLVRGLGAVYRESGIRGLYSGWVITAVRAFPANAIIFYTYEVCAKHWDDNIAQRWAQ